MSNERTYFELVDANHEISELKSKLKATEDKIQEMLDDLKWTLEAVLDSHFKEEERHEKSRKIKAKYNI